MTRDKNQPNTPQADQDMAEQVSNPNSSKYRPNWIMPNKDTHTSNRTDDQQHNQEDNTSSSTGKDETLGIP